MLPRVFELFVQADRPLDRVAGRPGDRPEPGPRRWSRCTAGSVAAHSDGPGRGSEFVVRLPGRRPAAPADGRRGDAGRGRRRRGRARAGASWWWTTTRDAARRLARLLTRLYGQEVRVAHDGPAALEAAARFRPEVVLLDIGLPGMDGYEVARRLRGRPGPRPARRSSP